MAEALSLAAAQACCVISVSQSPAANEESRHPSKGPWSGSGVLLTQNPGIVLCHGIIFSPFLLAAECPCSSQRRVLLPDSFSPDIQIQVLVLHEHSSKTDSRNWLGGKSGGNIPAMRLSPLSNLYEAPSGLKHHKAELMMMVPCLRFQDAFSKVFSASDQWHFGGNEGGQESDSLADDLRFLHWFALLRILDGDSTGTTGWMSCVPARLLRKGDPLFACGSPFGSFCPDLFMNTLSKGIVSNVAGEGNAIILTDARCLPGTEGGGVFATLGTNLHLVGIIVAPLCWKSNEWVGLTLVCAIDHIFASIRSVISGSRHQSLKTWLNPRQLVAKTHGKVIARDGLDRQMLATVALVECGPIWGSGVLVNSRLVLTCRHVVNGASSVCVRLQHSPAKASKGKVVFATKDTSPYDVALVELEESVSSFVQPVLASSFSTGEDVSIVGFGAFGQNCGPSVTSGILSAVITVEGTPVMLQATCAVHSGSSGGALFATKSGKLLGIVASNTRDHSIGATYPHLNFSIPITVLQPALLDYTRTKNLCGFRELDRVGDRIRLVWRLQRDPVEVPLSKL